MADASDQPERSTVGGADAGAYVRVENVWKSYGAGTPVIKNLNLSVAKGEFLTLLGPSGSGKTTTLMMLAGFEQVSGGAIVLGGRDISSVPPYRRGIGVVFQSYALFPHMTVAENLAYPLTTRGLGRAEIRERVAAALQMIRMSDFASRYPAKLSGGQQQRVAVARAMIFRPGLILMDEPLGALDRQLREEMQREIKDLHDLTGATIVYVTHDQSEALSMSDRIAVFNKGRIEQIGSPQEVYRNPATPFVASFIGETNWLAGTVVSAGEGELKARLSSGEEVLCRSKDGLKAGDEVKIAVRPENIVFDRAPEPASCLKTKTLDLTYLGLCTRIRLARENAGELLAVVSQQVPGGYAKEAAEVWFSRDAAIPFAADAT
ncbi:MAG: ABC transporter ATP-binding protein [Rhizobiales bacterium]|nr:ABC transporter ATP-binding protein [Hyphomicrobiales bacterium]